MKFNAAISFMIFILKVDPSTEFRELLRIASNKVYITLSIILYLLVPYREIVFGIYSLWNNSLPGNYKEPCNAWWIKSLFSLNSCLIQQKSQNSKGKQVKLFDFNRINDNNILYLI